MTLEAEGFDVETYNDGQSTLDAFNRRFVLNSLRDNHVLVIVEDTRPEILKGALGKVFNRFYSERPANDFGNNSGLGLAISKQIVKAHDGVIGLKISVQHKWTRHLRRLAPVL